MTKHKHTFSGEDEAMGLISWLNSGQSAGRRRIAEILGLYDEIEKAPPYTDPWPRATPLFTRLQKLLDRYAYKFKAIARDTIVVSARKRTGDSSREFSLFLSVQRLREMILLSRVRRCANCGQWIFARFPSQKFCTDACRVKSYQSDQGWIERRNAERKRIYHQRKKNPHLKTQTRRGRK
jgi:hypothetical protein